MTNTSEKDISEKDKPAISLGHYIGAKLKELFVENIPLDTIRELHDKRWRNVLGFFSCATMLAVFIYFVVSTYQSTMTSPFISIDMGAGTCSFVPKEITGDYLVSLDGYWEGSPQFNYSRAIFQFSFNHFVASNSTFASFVREVASAFSSQNTDVVGLFQGWSLALSLIFLQSVQFSTVLNGNVQTIQFTPDPATVYSGYQSLLSLTDSTAACQYFKRSGVSTASILSATVNLDKSMIGCPSSQPFLELLGFVELVDDSSFTLSIDMRSVVVATATNFGFGLQLEPVVFPEYMHIVQEINFAGVLPLTVFEYFSKRFAGMTPVVCVAIASTGEIVFCLLKIGDKFVLPLVNSFGGPKAVNENIPDYCDCNTEVGHTAECNQLTTIISFISSKVPYNDTLSEISFFLNMVFTRENFQNFNRLSYNAAFLSVVGSSDAEATLYELCRSDCFLMAFFIDQSPSLSVSPYSLQYSNGSCSYSMLAVIPWEQLVNNPPVNLNADYYTCVSKPGDALFNAFGVSNGNASLAMQILGVLLLPIIFYVTQAFGVKPRLAEYENDELQQLSRDIAIQLLRIRDGKTRGISKTSLLRRLQADLDSAMHEVAGYADSDDEDEERSLKDVTEVNDAAPLRKEYTFTEERVPPCSTILDPNSNSFEDL